MYFVERGPAAPLNTIRWLRFIYFSPRGATSDTARAGGHLASRPQTSDQICLRDSNSLNSFSGVIIRPWWFLVRIFQRVSVILLASRQ